MIDGAYLKKLHRTKRLHVPQTVRLYNLRLYSIVFILLEENTSKESRSELLADIHLVKLFMHHTLRFERTVHNQGALPKLEKDCVKLSFVEMRNEGYADDGLFPIMSEFFLPLTISEAELKVSKSNVNRQVRQSQLEVLTKEIGRLKKLSSDETVRRWDIDEKLTNLKQDQKQKSRAYENKRSRIHTTTSSHDQARKLRQIDREWEENREQFEVALDSLNSTLNESLNRIKDYEKKLDDCYNKISNIKNESSQPSRPVDKGLVKPARGFIMYGPPGNYSALVSYQFSRQK